MSSICHLFGLGDLDKVLQKMKRWRYMVCQSAQQYPSSKYNHNTFQRGTPHYSDKLCSDRCYSDSPCTVWTSGGWLQLNRPTGSTDWKDAEPNPENQLRWKYVVTLPEEGAPETHWDTHTLHRLRSPQSPQCLDQCRAFDASNASTHSNFFPISTISTYAKRAKDALGRPDCRLSE